jgi:hypothetical protein
MAYTPLLACERELFFAVFKYAEKKVLFLIYDVFMTSITFCLWSVDAFHGKSGFFVKRCNYLEFKILLIQVNISLCSCIRTCYANGSSFMYSLLLDRA